MLKKVFSVVLCVVLTCSMLSAFAITTIHTETTHGLADGEIAVVTTVTGTTNEATYTYLAHAAGADLAALQPAQVVYVDEKKANGTELTFEYTTTDDKIGSAVRVSGVAGDTLPELAPEFTHQVVLDGAEAVNGTIEGLDAVADDAYVLVEVAGLTEKKVVAVTVDSVAVDYLTAANGVRIMASALKNKEVAPVVAITTEAYTYASVRTEGLGVLENDTKDSEGEAAVIACAQVLGAVEEFGIEFSDNVEFSTANEGVLWKAAALGKGSDGRFAVKLAKYTEWISADAPVYARAYYVLGGNTVYGPTWVTNNVAE